MKLGICYMVFDGEELLEFAIKAIRKVVDHVSVTYQTLSYFGNPASIDLEEKLNHLKFIGLIDELIYYQPDLSIHHKTHELNLRNIGLEASKKAGCTHHISCDVDEFYEPHQLQYAKEVIDKNNYDFTAVYQKVYYKKPTYLVIPNQNLVITFIHSIDNEYVFNLEFPFKIEITRRFESSDNYKIFSIDEVVLHHMSYVRKDIRKKFQNSDNAQFYKLEKFYNIYDTYQVGGRVCLLPDYLNRKTVEVDNIFSIQL